MKELRRSSLIILRKFFLKSCKVEFAFFVFIWVFFHEYSHFHSFHGHLDISRVITAESSPLCIVNIGLEPGNFGFLTQVTYHQAALSLEFSLSTTALVTAVVRIFKTRQTLGNISRVLLYLIKIYF